MQRQDAERTTLYAQQQYAYQFPFLIAAVSTRSLRLASRWHEVHRKDEIKITQFGLFILFIITLSIFTYSHLATSGAKHYYFVLALESLHSVNTLPATVQFTNSPARLQHLAPSRVNHWKPWTKFAPSLSSTHMSAWLHPRTQAPPQNQELLWRMGDSLGPLWHGLQCPPEPSQPKNTHLTGILIQCNFQMSNFTNSN